MADLLLFGNVYVEKKKETTERERVRNNRLGRHANLIPISILTRFDFVYFRYGA